MIGRPLLMGGLEEALLAADLALPNLGPACE
jgi:hypothetical protein